MNFPIIQQHDDLIQAVSAREIFDFLGVKDRFSVWMDRMLGYGFVENQDYLGCRYYDTRANQELQDYFVTIDTAKEISMLQRSEKGRQVRQYFIECESKAQQANQQAIALPQDYLSALKALVSSEEEKQVIQAKVAELEPKAAALDVLSHVKGAVGIRAAAKALGIPERQFIARCMDENKPINARFLYRDNHGKLNAYAHRIKQGFMTQKITSYQGKNGLDFASIEVKFTPKGLAHIAELMQVAPITIEHSKLRLVN